MELSRIIESIIFVSESPVQPAQVVEILDSESLPEIMVSEEEVATAMENLVQKYEDDSFVFELKKIDKGYQFFTKKEFYPFLHQAALMRNRKKLSRAALETLSIVAYKQPVTKTEIEFIRGVSCDYAIQKLLEKNLVQISGRSDAPGRPLLYKTSDFFMEYFGINDMSDLPKLTEFDMNEEEYQEQFKVYLEENEELTQIIEEGKNPDEVVIEGNGQERQEEQPSSEEE